MARKQPGFLSRGATFLRYVLLAATIALLMGLRPMANLPLFSMGRLPAVAHTPVVKTAVQDVADASHLVQQGKKLYQAGHFSKAAVVWRQGAEAYQVQKDKLHQAMVLSYLSLAYQQLGQWPQATEAIANSLKLLQINQDKSNSKDQLPVLAQALNTRGSLQLAQGQAEQALTNWQQAAATYAQADDEAGRIGSLINQAQAQQALGFYLQARKTLAGVEETLQQQQNLEIKTTGLLSLGNILRLIGDLNESRRVLQQSLAIAQQLASPQYLSATLLSLGNTARAQPNIEAALMFYRQAATISGSQTTQIHSQLNQLSLLLEAKRWSDAQTLWPEIQSLIINLPPSQAAVYAQINLVQSLARLRQNTTTDTPSWSQIAQVAATAVQQAESLDDQRAKSYALGSLGGLYEKTEQWSDAQDLTQRALLLAQANNAPDIAYRWQWQLGRLLKIQGQRSGAIAAYTEAVNILQSLRSDLIAINSEVQFSFREGVEPVYRELVGLLLQADSTEPSPDQLEQARKVIESLQLAELDNFFRTACLNATPVQIDSVDQKAAVIYPIILENRLEVVLSLPQQSLRHYAVSLSQEQVESTVVQLQQFLVQGRAGRQFLPLSQQVYNWLIRPAEADLVHSEVKTLVFVLDGVLRNTPMAALHDGERYLIEKYAIALTPGLELLQSQPLKRGQLKALTAGLSEARQGFSALIYVEPELNQIRSQMPSEVLLNQKFTSATLQQQINKLPFPIVHLATHSQFSSKAEETFILTWNDRINVRELNVILRTTDLRRSSPIELLVLSACETAKGDNRAALGLAGVAVRAGARSTLATLWTVEDEATAALMSRFYRELAKATVTKAEALRRAQQSILQDPRYRQHPYYWAPYVLVGNWL